MSRDELTPTALEHLLARIDADLDRAAERYAAIRSRLERLFAWRGCGRPEELADQTIDRVARRLQEGSEVRPPDPWAYFAGVAHNVFRETLRASQRERAAIEAWSERRETEMGEEDPRLLCLDRCLESLPAPDRAVILRYHEGAGRQRIEARTRLTQELGVSAGALRVRSHRVRGVLESCIDDCMAGVTNEAARPYPGREERHR